MSQNHTRDTVRPAVMSRDCIVSRNKVMNSLQNTVLCGWYCITSVNVNGVEQRTKKLYINSVFNQGRSRDFTLVATEAERHQGAEGDGDWGGVSPSLTD